MRCPECGTNGYSRKTRTPEWRCRKCGHEWDVDLPLPLETPSKTYRKITKEDVFWWIAIPVIIPVGLAIMTGLAVFLLSAMAIIFWAPVGWILRNFIPEQQAWIIATIFYGVVVTIWWQVLYVTGVEWQNGRHRVAKSIGIVAASAYGMTMFYLAMWWFGWFIND